MSVSDWRTDWLRSRFLDYKVLCNQKWNRNKELKDEFYLSVSPPALCQAQVGCLSCWSTTNELEPKTGWMFNRDLELAGQTFQRHWIMQVNYKLAKLLYFPHCNNNQRQRAANLPSTNNFVLIPRFFSNPLSAFHPLLFRIGKAEWGRCWITIDSEIYFPYLKFAFGIFITFSAKNRSSTINFRRAMRCVHCGPGHRRVVEKVENGGSQKQAITRRAENAELSESNGLCKIYRSMRVQKILSFCESIFSWRDKNEGVVFSTASPSLRHYH